MLINTIQYSKAFKVIVRPRCVQQYPLQHDQIKLLDLMNAFTPNFSLTFNVMSDF